LYQLSKLQLDLTFLVPSVLYTHFTNTCFNILCFHNLPYFEKAKYLQHFSIIYAMSKKINKIASFFKGAVLMKGWISTNHYNFSLYIFCHQKTAILFAKLIGLTGQFFPVEGDFLYTLYCSILWTAKVWTQENKSDIVGKIWQQNCTCHISYNSLFHILKNVNIYFHYENSFSVWSREICYDFPDPEYAALNYFHCFDTIRMIMWVMHICHNRDKSTAVCLMIHADCKLTSQLGNGS